MVKSVVVGMVDLMVVLPMLAALVLIYFAVPLCSTFLATDIHLILVVPCLASF